MSKATLADFARQLGITPELARQWKRRGKITETEDCFIYVNGESAATLAKDPALSVTVPSSWIPSSVTTSAQDSRLWRREAEVGERQPESHRESCADCEALQERVRKLEADVTVTLNAYLARLESRLTVCERDNATLQRFIDGLRDRVTALEAAKAINCRMGIDLSCLETRVSELEVASKSSNTIDSPSVGWGA
jgi:hypothetical protein